MRTVLATSLLTLALFLPCACSHDTPPASSPGPTVSATKAAAATHACGADDKTQAHDLNGEGPTEALSPCAKSGAGDYSGVIKIETLPEGIHITINATDDDVDNGVLGSDVKKRDAVIVYPKGKGTKEAIEVPLIRTKDGYVGDKIVLFDQLENLTDEGTKIDVAIFDHDKGQGDSEEMHVSVAVSTGKSCEKARDENPDTIDMGAKGGGAELTQAQLGAPINGGQFMAGCGLPQSAGADICVTIKKGVALGVSVKVNPKNNRVAACIDRAARRIHFPVGNKIDVIKTHF
jgi:hypothetical protein